MAADDARFEAMRQRLQRAVDVVSYWGTVRSILEELLPAEPSAASLFRQGGRIEQQGMRYCAGKPGDSKQGGVALLIRLHPHLQAALRRLDFPDEHVCREDAPSERPDPSAPSVPIVLLRDLTPAERTLVLLLRQGCSNKEIASRLNKSIRTVKTQLTSVYKKYAVRSRSRLLALLR